MMIKTKARKTTVIMLTVLLALVLAACGDSGGSPAEADLFDTHFDGYAEKEEVAVPDTDDQVIVVKDGDGETMGAVVYTAIAGYGGDIQLEVVLDRNYQVLELNVLEHEESPGLGDGIESEEFRQQFVGKGPGDSYELDIDIDTVTDATLSTKAVIQGVLNSMEQAEAAIQ